MPTNDYQVELETAIEAVRGAARLCRAVQQEVSAGILEKEDKSPVTVADFGSQALVCRRLARVFPDDPVIAEEDAASLRKPENDDLRDRVISHVMQVQPLAELDRVLDWIDHGNATTYSDRFWTLDPIDGTKGFLRAEQYAVALALIVDGEVTVAALACPNLVFDGGTDRHTGAIFAAVKGEGTFRIPMDVEDGPHVVRVSDLSEVSRARFCESVESGHSSHGDAASVAHRLGITREPIRMDSQTKYAVVASGGADIYLRLPTRPGYVERIWDHAAGALIIAEAGGTVTDIEGKPLDFRQGAGLKQNRGVVATNGHLHEEVLGALHEVGVA